MASINKSEIVAELDALKKQRDQTIATTSVLSGMILALEKVVELLNKPEACEAAPNPAEPPAEPPKAEKPRKAA